MSARIGLASYAARRRVRKGVVTVFDRGAPAKIIIEGRSGPLQIELVINNVLVPLDTKAERLAPDRACLILQPPTDTTGSGTLDVRPAMGDARRWSVQWRPPPMQQPDLRAIQGTLDRGDTKAAFELLDAAGAADDEGAFWMLFLRGRVHRHLGQWRDTVTHWTEAANVAVGGGWTTHGARALRAAAFMLWRFGQLGEADAQLRRVRDLDRATDDIEGRPNTQYYMGLVASSRSGYTDAFNHLYASRAAMERLGRPLTFLHPALAMVCLDIGEYDRAAEHARALAEGLDAQRLGPHEVIAGYLSAGWVLLQTARRRGDTQASDATALFDQAEQVIARIADPMPRVTLHLNRAWHAWWAGESERARHHVEVARSLAGDLGPDREAERNELELALLGVRLNLVGGEFDEAVGRAKKLLEHALRTTSGVPSTLSWAARHALGRAALASGSPSAVLHLEAAFEDLQTVSLALDRRDLAGFFGDRPQVCDPTELFDALVDEAWAASDIERAFHWAHTAHVLHRRAHDLGEMLTSLSDDARQRWRSVGEELAAVRTRYDAILDDWQLTPPSREQALRRAARAIRQLFDRRLRIIDQHATKADASIAKVKERLHSDEALALLRTRANGEVEVWWLDTEGTTRVVTTAVGAHITRRLGERRRVIVVADHRSGGWELPTFTGDASTPLSARVALSFLPHLGLMATETPSPIERAVVIADPRLDLPHAHRDGERLQAIGPSTAVLLGRDATRSATLDALERCDLLHFSGHGETDPDEPDSVYLRLVGGDTLRAADILAEGPRPARVVLNGCQTGRAFAEQAMSLPVAFLMAGSRSVLATVSPIGDAAASRFIRRFYAHGGGNDPGAALVAASRESIAAGDDIWSAYRLIGRT